MKFSFDSPEEMFEHSGRTREHGYTLSSPCRPDGSGELKLLRFLLIELIEVLYFIFSQSKCTK